MLLSHDGGHGQYVEVDGSLHCSTLRPSVMENPSSPAKYQHLDDLVGDGNAL